LRVYKRYEPREEEGELNTISDINQMDLTKNKWLILSRTTSRLRDIIKNLESIGIYYQTKKGKSYSVKLYKAIINYTRWSKGEELTENEMKDVKEYTGESMNQSLTWFEAFEKAPREQVNYIRLMLSNGEKLKEPARIYLSTIHAAKGGEEENVILILDNAKKIRQSLENNTKKRDEEHRVWYVGATRAKNNLYLMRAKIESYGYQL